MVFNSYFPSFSPELPIKEPPVIWTTFRSLCVEKSFLVLIRKDLSKDKVMKTSNRLQETFCWTLPCIRSVLQKGFVGEVKIYSQCIQLYCNRGFIVFTSSTNGFLYLKIQPGIFCMLAKLKTYFKSFCQICVCHLHPCQAVIPNSQSLIDNEELIFT